MSAPNLQDVLIVVRRADGSSEGQVEHRIQLPPEASLAELLVRLEEESPELFKEVRSRVLRAAGRVLAYGRDDSLLPTVSRQLASGGPVVFPDQREDEDSKAPPAT